MQNQNVARLLIFISGNEPEIEQRVVDIKHIDKAARATMPMMWGQSSAARILCLVCTFYTFAVVAAASNSTSPAAIGASLVDEESGEVVAAGQPAPKGQSVSKWQHIMTKRRGKKGLKTRRRGRPNGRPNNRQPGQAPSRQQRPNRPNNRPSRQQRPNRQQNNNNK